MAITTASNRKLASAIEGAEVYVGSGVWKGNIGKRTAAMFKLCGKVPKRVGQSQRVIMKCGKMNGLEGNRIVVNLKKKKSSLVLCEVDVY